MFDIVRYLSSTWMHRTYACVCPHSNDHVSRPEAATVQASLKRIRQGGEHRQDAVFEGASKFSTFHFAK